MMKLIEVVTKRKDSLFGCWYGEDFREACVIVTNGTGGNIFENKFLGVLGGVLEENKISFIYAHNSGAFQIIDFHSEKERRSGLTFELFDNCLEDLQAYVDFAKEQGYKHIILGGHSYGCNKVIYYLYKNSKEPIEKFILISPVDTEDRTDGERKPIDELLDIANKYKANGELDKILPMMYDDYNFYTAGSFLDYINNSNHKNLPIYHDKKNFEQLKSIKILGLFIMGERDSFGHKDTQKHLEIIKENSGNHKNKIKVVANAGHTFHNTEEFCEAILDFVKN